MSIVGSKPEAGVRIDVERPREGGPPWQYRGVVATPAEDVAIEATVAAGGEVTIGPLPPGAPDGIAEKARLLLRAAWKHAQEEGLPPPRHVVRWRADSGLASPGRAR